MTTNLRMTQLRDSFPSLRGRFGTLFNAQEVADFCRDPAVTSGSGNAAKFVLSVWSGPGPLRFNGETREGGDRIEIDDWRWPGKILPFDLHAALGGWDESHRAAFLAWAQDPWWV